MTPSGLGTRQTSRGIAYSHVRLEPAWSPDSRLPVLFQHGLGLDRTLWNPWLRHALAQRTVVAADLRGHGGSVPAWRPGVARLGDFAGDVLSVLDDCGIDRCHYVGESFGGTLGLHLAGTAGDRFASVTALSTGWKGAWFRKVRDWEGLLATGGIAAWSRALTEARFDPERTDPRLLAWVEQLQQRMDPEVVWTTARCLLECDLSDLLPGITIPVLTVLADSPFVDPRNLTGLVSAVPRAEAGRIPGARHGIVLSHWRECADLCFGFLDRAERAEP